MALDRSQITLPVLPKEAVPVEELGGEVVVRGMLLSQRLANDTLNRTLRQPREGESEEQARARAGSVVIPRVLSQCVVDGSDAPLMTQEEWDVFGAAHDSAVYRLFNVAMRLSGHVTPAIEGIEKN